MENGTYVIVGVQHIHSEKNGKVADYTRFTAETEFNEYAQKNGAVGMDVETFFLTGNITDIGIGDIVKPYYSKGFNNQAILDGLDKIVEA